MKGRKQDAPKVGGKAGDWILDSTRRLFITGARKTATYKRADGYEINAPTGKILLLVTLRVRNAAARKTTRIGLGYIDSNVVSSEGTQINDARFDIPGGEAGAMTAVLPPGAEAKATLVFTVPTNFTPEKIKLHLSNLGEAPIDKRVQEVSLTNCDFTIASEQFDVAKAPKPPMPKGVGGANQQNGDVQGKAGTWVSDKYRRVFVTGIRRMDSYKRNKDNSEIRVYNPNEKLYAVTLVVQNIMPGQKSYIGLGYIVSNLAGADGTAMGDPQFDIPKGEPGGMTRQMATGESSTATLIFRGPADFKPKAVLLHLSHLGNVKTPRVARISLDNCDLDATAPQFNVK
jgi:hypothetical protein